MNIVLSLGKGIFSLRGSCVCFLHITLYKLSSTHFPSELSWRTKLNPSTQCRTCKRSRSRSTRTRAGALLTRPPWRLPLRFPKAISVLARIPQLVIAPLHGWVVFGSRWTCWTAFPSALALLSFACLAAFQQRRLLASQCDDSDNIAGSKAWESIGKSLKDLENVREGSNRRRRNLRRLGSLLLTERWTTAQFGVTVRGPGRPGPKQEYDVRTTVCDWIPYRERGSADERHGA